MQCDFFAELENERYPCFLLDEDFKIIHSNACAQNAPNKIYFMDNLFEQIFCSDPSQKTNLENGSQCVFTNKQGINPGESIFAIKKQNNYFCMVNTLCTPLSIPLVYAEIRERISSIFATIPLIEKKLEYDPNSLMYSQNMTRNCYMLLRCAQNINAFEKIRNDKTSSLVNLNLLLKNLVDFIKIVFTDIPITLNVPDEEIYIDCNLEIAEISITNIILNSITYTRDNNEINISLTKNANNAVLVFADKGTGIKPQALEHVFVPYYSVDPYMDGEPNPGLGLGLAIVHASVTAKGGSCTIQSEFGEGTKIAVSLPIATQDSAILENKKSEYYLNRFSTPFVQLGGICKLPI